MRTEDSEVRRTIVSRRAFLRAAAISASAAVIAACGGAPATQQPAPPPTTAPGAAAPTTAPAQVEPAQQVTIEWFNRYTTPTTQEVIPLMIGEFEKQNPTIKVQYQNPGNGEGYIETLLSRIAGGNPPDVATLYEPPVEFAARGSLLAIDDYMQSARTARPDAIFEAPLKSCQWQGKTYGLPSSAGAAAMYVNVGMFREKGITFSRDTFPKTWDEIRALSREFAVVENGQLQQSGFVPFGNSWIYPAWSAMNGGKLYDSAATRYTLDSDANVAWLDYWLKWLNEDFGGDIEQLNVAGNWAGTYPETAFNLGRASMATEGSWSTTDAEIPFEFDVAKLPFGPGGNRSLTAFWPNWWVVPKGTKNPEAAFLLVEFIATSGWQIWYEYIMDTPSWKAFPPTILTTKLVNAVGQEKAQDYNSFFANYLNDAVEMWTSPVETFANDTLGSAVGEVLAKRKSPKEALAEAQALCQARLEETLKGQG